MALSHGESELTEQRWGAMLALEAARAQRLPPLTASAAQQAS